MIDGRRRKPWRLYEVTVSQPLCPAHCFERWARSEKEAINFVRYLLYSVWRMNELVDIGLVFRAKEKSAGAQRRVLSHELDQITPAASALPQPTVTTTGGVQLLLADGDFLRPNPVF